MAISKLVRSNLSFHSVKSLKEYVVPLILDNLDVDITQQSNPVLYSLLLDLWDRYPEETTFHKMIPIAFNMCTNNSLIIKIQNEGRLYVKENYRPHFQLYPQGKWYTYSLNKCFTGRNMTLNQIVSNAFRYAVSGQINAFRSTCNSCVLCGRFTGDFEVDHTKINFSHLVDNFMDDTKTNINMVKLTRRGIHFDLEEEGYKTRWLEYHKEHATLQLLCVDCHLNKTRKIDI